MKLLSALIFALILLGSIAQPVVAETTSNGRLIRGSGPSIYWITNDGSRYVFPDVTTYYTWFADFKNVKRVSDTEIQRSPLKGNVTYRPGAKLIKIEGRPEVFAVSRSNELRLIANEKVARQMYGNNWRSYIRFLPESLMNDYHFGKSIIHAWDYHVASEYHGVKSPSDDIVRMIGPVWPKPSINLMADYPYNGDPTLVSLSASIQGPAFSGPHTIVIYDKNQKVLAKCNDYQCSAMVKVTPTDGGGWNSYYAYVENGKKTIPIDTAGVYVRP